MPDSTFNCVDCRAPSTARRPNAKYCDVCRLWRDLMFVGARRHRCLDCEESFAPTRVADKLCATCDFIGSRKYAEGECAFCHRSTDPLLCVDVRVCRRCARDPERRSLLIKAVKAKRNSRRETFQAAVT